MNALPLTRSGWTGLCGTISRCSDPSWFEIAVFGWRGRFPAAWGQFDETVSAEIYG
jgi:hypothetical protein